MSTHYCSIKDICNLNVPNPEYGDMKLNVFPIDIENSPLLPKEFSIWEETLDSIIEHIPLVDGCNQHYVTIDSKFFTVDDFLRREGVHMDGNFCADVNFSRPTWGGTRTSWGGVSIDKECKIITPWVSPYNVEVPYGTYVSDSLGGIFCASSEIGCRAWQGTFEGEIGDEGDFSNMKNQLNQDNEVLFKKNRLYFMSSNTPHESLKIAKGTRRTFIRVTLNHNYPNELIRARYVQTYPPAQFSTSG